MNIPEITNEMKQGIRSESVTNAQSVDRAYRSNGSSTAPPDAVQKQHGTQQGDTQPQDFSREELNTLVKETEDQLELNDVKLKFNILEEEEAVQIEIIGSDGKTIRKIPGDDFLKMSKSLKNLGSGVLDEVS